MMDHETKIYIDKLVEAVDKLYSPDWWTIGITVVNALIMIWLGWRQYKLQQQQTKLQEYNVNSRLYKLIKDIDNQLDWFIFRTFTFYIPERGSKDEPFANEITDISNLLEEFNQNFVDLELKYPSEKSTLENYRNILIEMMATYKLFYMMVSIEKKNNQTIYLDDSLSMDCLLQGEKKQKEVLLSLIPNNFYKSMAIDQINGFITHKTELLKLKFARRIAKRCNVN